AVQFKLVKRFDFTSFIGKRVVFVISDDIAVFIKFERIGVYILFLNMVGGYDRCDELLESTRHYQSSFFMLFEKFFISSKRPGYLFFHMSYQLVQMAFICTLELDTAC